MCFRSLCLQQFIDKHRYLLYRGLKHDADKRFWSKPADGNAMPSSRFLCVPNLILENGSIQFGNNGIQPKWKSSSCNLFFAGTQTVLFSFFLSFSPFFFVRPKIQTTSPCSLSLISEYKFKVRQMNSVLETINWECKFVTCICIWYRCFGETNFLMSQESHD